MPFLNLSVMLAGVALANQTGNVPAVPEEVVGQFIHMANPPAGGDAFKQGQDALNAPAMFSGAADWERAMAALLGREHVIEMDADYADNDVNKANYKDRVAPNFGCYDTALPGSPKWPDFKCDNFKDWNHADQFKLSFVTVGGNGKDGKSFTVPTSCANPVEQQWFDPKNPTKCITGNDNGAWSTKILDEYYLNRHSGVDFTAEFKKNGFNAIMFDIEEVHQADGTPITRGDQMDEVIAKFESVFQKAADAGILVAITTSWCGPFGLNGVPDMKLKLVKSWAADDNVHMLVPQMYSQGNEGFNPACTAASCPSDTCPASAWKAMFNNDKQAIVPAIGKAGEWPQWKNWLSQMEVEHRAKGYFQWLQPASFDMFKKASMLLI
jgi:hypothetical protein